MKAKLTILSVLVFFSLNVIMLLTSCATIDYVQVYKTDSENVKKSRTDLSQLQTNGEVMFYADGNCDVYYNLWKEGGDIGFRFHNKTDQNIYLNIDECFFVLNGIAYDYYQNRSYNYSSNIGTAIGSNISNTNATLVTNIIGSVPQLHTSSVSQGHSVTYIEAKVVCIPAKASKIISEFSINKTPYRDCDLIRFPNKKDPKTKAFSKANSPFVFSNVITYTINNERKKIENQFYVIEIANLPLKDVIKMQYEGFCGDSSAIKSVQTFRNASADKFYIEYSRSKSNTAVWKH